MFRTHVRDRLSAYYHGELPAEGAQRVTAHLERCGHCRREFDEIRFGAELAARLPAAEAPITLWPDIDRALRRNSAAVRARRWPWRGLAAATAMLVLGLGVWLISSGRPAVGWEVVSLEGQPLVGSDRVRNKARISVGEWLETDGSSRAQIRVGDIGQVAIEPNTRIQLIDARRTDHRLALDRGTIRAQIWAPPRLFFVETPSALVVDLGCVYAMNVDENGAGLLHVTTGWVLLEDKGREATVPAGALCRTRPGSGPGTPYFEDASQALRTALAKLDFERGGAAALDIVLAESRPRDTLTLWHLLWRVERPGRDRVYDRMASLAFPPKDVRREDALRLDPAALNRWKEELQWTW